MNAALEFHDSEVVGVESAAGAVIVRLAAYVHRSDGRPGFDGERLVVRGAGLEVVAAGEGELLERYPGVQHGEPGTGAPAQ